MTYAGAIRAIAMGVLLAAVTACGGGGGSGGDDDGGGSTPRPDVALPNISSARQKALTPDNSKTAVIVALNAITFIEDGVVPAPRSVDFFADSFADSSSFLKASRALGKVRPSGKTVDVSSQFCLSGTASVDAGDSVIGKMVQRYSNCDTGGLIFDGTLELDIRGYLSSEQFTDVTFTFRGLRLTGDGEDSVFDGTVVMTTNYPGAGFVQADLDIRDLSVRKGIRVIGYRADFDIDYAYRDYYYSSYVYKVRQLQGRIYDDEGYVDLGLTPAQAPWPMLQGKASSLMLSPSGIAAPYQVKLALDADGDNTFEYSLFADLDALSPTAANDSAPEFHVDNAPIHMDKGERREIIFGGVTDADQQFVNVTLQLTEQPTGSDPIFDASADGFVFSSSVAGDYRVSAVASDGQRTASHDFNIRVMYDMPEISTNAPQAAGFGETIHFSISVLNPEEGNIEVIAAAMPGLHLDNSGVVTYTPVIPDFGVDQQVDLLFTVRNEDRQQQVAFPIAIAADAGTHLPVLLSAHRSGDERLAGNFDLGAGDEEARELFGPYNSESPIAIFKQDGENTYRYRQSYDLDALFGAERTSLLGANDFDGDGIEELIFSAWYQGGKYVAYFNTVSGKIEKRIYIDSNSDSLFSSYKEHPALQRANIDAHGGDEYVLFVKSAFIVFDEAMNFLWKTSTVESGYHGYIFAIANVDNDQALEIITEKGFVLDGGSHQWQQKINIDESNRIFFADDVDQDGQNELYFSDGVSLHRVAQNGDVTVTNPGVLDIGSMRSNLLVTNVDSDLAKELVWVSHSDNDQLDLIVYLDYASGMFTLKSLHDIIQSYFGNSYWLEYQPGKIEGMSSVLYPLGNGSNGFVYNLADESLNFRMADTDIALGDQNLNGYFGGGTAISSDNQELIFCGLGNRSGFDLFSYNMGSSYLDTDTYTMVPDAGGYSITSWENSVCYSSSFARPGERFIVSGQFMTLGNWGGQVLTAKVQDVDGGTQIFHMDVPAGGYGPLLFRDGNIAGDSVAELVIAQGAAIRIYDVFAQRLLGELVLPSNEVVRSLALSPPVFAGGKAKIAVTTDERVLVLDFSEPRGLTIAAEALSRDLWGSPKPLAFSGKTLVVGHRESPGPFSDEVFHADLYDDKLQHLGEWLTEDVVRAMKPIYLPDGSSFLVTINGYPGTMKWRDPATGHVLYAAPDAIYGVTLRNVADFQLLFDESAQHVKAVIIDAEPSFGENANRIVITH